jgi:hypothetical protein
VFKALLNLAAAGAGLEPGRYAAGWEELTAHPVIAAAATGLIWLFVSETKPEKYED